MSKHTISFGLSPSSIDDALKQLEAYMTRIQKATAYFMEDLAILGCRRMEQAINRAQADTEGGGGGVNDASTTWYKKEETGTSVVFTIEMFGEGVLFVEFGAGVHFNDNLHGSPHPQGVELGYTIGDYPSEHPPSQGRYDGWMSPFGYTHGQKAACAIPAAMNEMRTNLIKAAQEAWAQAG